MLPPRCLLLLTARPSLPAQSPAGIYGDWSNNMVCPLGSFLQKARMQVETAGSTATDKVGAIYFEGT